MTGTIIRYYVNQLRPSALRQADWFHTKLIGALPAFGRGESSRERVFQALRGRGDQKGVRGSIAFHGVALECEEIVRRHNIRVLAVTSGKPNEGKSTVVVGVAMALASAGLRILVVDCDMRKPSIARLFGNDTRGVVDTTLKDGKLQVREDLASSVHFMELPLAPSLSYLRSAEFDEILAMGRRYYDLVICDTPPVLTVPDALLVAKKADAVMLVAENGRNATNETDEIIRRVVVTRTPLCGVVLTKLTNSTSVSDVYTGYQSDTLWNRREQKAIRGTS